MNKNDFFHSLRVNKSTNNVSRRNEAEATQNVKHYFGQLINTICLQIILAWGLLLLAGGGG